jgi:hypothetical protein
MKRILHVIAGTLLAGLCSAAAQQATTDANPLSSSLSVSISTHTLVVPPIAGVPFSATAVIENKRFQEDGTVAETRLINLIGRDSIGRTHGEMRQYVPISSNAEPPLKSVSIYDPQAEILTEYTISTHIATLQHQSRQRSSRTVIETQNPLVKVEDLGASFIDGIDAKGTRRSVTIPAGASGSSAPLTVVDEYWYSDDLHEDLLLIHKDPRTGEQKVMLTDIKRGDPDPSFFEVPEGYKIVDMNPPAGAPIMQHNVTGNAVNR